jgi:peptide subunit release factor 1 (eRF1)
MRHRGGHPLTHVAGTSIAEICSMAHASPTAASPLRRQLHTLAAFEPTDSLVVSLYLSLVPDQHGRDHHDVFCRRAFADQLKAVESRAGDHAALSRVFGRIETYLASEVAPSANGVAIFAADGDDGLFEAVQLDAPIDHHWLFIGAVPHLYPLARLIDQYPRYAAVLLDSNHARILVFAAGAIEGRTEVSGEKTRRHSMGGWSQARYQRRVDNIRQQHVEEVVEALDGIVRAEQIQHVIVAGDDVVVPMFQKALPAHLASAVVDVMRLDRSAGEAELIGEALAALRQQDAGSDAARVAEVLGAWRAGGLGVAGPEATLRALQLGQVDEVLITAVPDALKAPQRLPEDAAPVPIATETTATGNADTRQLHLADELVTRAAQTGARLRVVEDPALLAEQGGVAAALRFRI